MEANKTIIELHKEVFDFLMEKRKTMPDLYFTLNTNTKELEKGYIFRKNDDEGSIVFSFWKFGHNLQIYFTVSNDELVLNIIDLDHRLDLSDRLIDKIQNSMYNSIQYDGRLSPGLDTIVKYYKNYGEWRTGFNYFFEQDFQILDECLKNHIPRITKKNFDSWLAQLKHFGHGNAQTNVPDNFKINSQFKLQSLFLKNIGHFEELNLDLSKNVTILIGENGSGKSTVLRALALGIAGLNTFDLDQDFKKEKNQFLTQILRITDYEQATPLYAETGEIGVKMTKDVHLHLLFKPSALVAGKVEAEEADTEDRLRIVEKGKYLKQTMIGFSQSQKSMSLVFDNKLNHIPQVIDLFPLISGTSPNFMENLVEWIYYYVHDRQSEQAVDHLFALFSKIISQEISLKKPDKTAGAIGSPTGQKNMIVCTPESPNGIDLSLVSQGYHNIFRWLGGMMMKLWAVKETFYFHEPINQISAIVLIDEIDTYLHPKWQRNILKVLVEEFPNIQFVVTTHSPVVLGYLRNWKEVGAYKIEKQKAIPLSHFYGRNPIDLFWELYGIEARPQEIQEKITLLYDLFDQDKIEEAKLLLTELDEILGENDPIVGELKSSISLMEELNHEENQ